MRVNRVNVISKVDCTIIQTWWTCFCSFDILCFNDYFNMYWQNAVQICSEVIFWNDLIYTDTWWRHQNGNIFRLTGSLCGKFTGHRWILRTKASDAYIWCFVWSAPWINGLVNNCGTGDLRRHGAHYDVIVMNKKMDALYQTKQRPTQWEGCNYCLQGAV